MSTANSDSLTSFPFWVSFTSFLLSFPWVGIPMEPSKLCWIRVDILVLVLKLEGKLSAFHNWDVSYSFVVYGFNYVEVCSLYLPFLESFFFFFNHKWVNFVKSFFCIYWNVVQSLSHAWLFATPWTAACQSIEMLICLLFFNLFMWYNSVTDLQILKTPCILGIIPPDQNEWPF